MNNAISYSSLCHDYFAFVADGNRQGEMKALEALFDYGTVETEHAGAMSRSQAGENITLALKADETTVLNRTVLSGKRNQSFSVSTKSKRVKLDMVDKRMLRMRTDADKVSKHADLKRQNFEAPHKMLDKIDRKLIELGTKLIKAVRLGKDTTALDALILRCRYYKHTQSVRLNGLIEAAIERDEKKPEPLTVGGTTKHGFTVQPESKAIVPASTGRSYKVKRKVLKDRIVKHGAAETGHVAIKPHRKPRKSKPQAKRGAGSY